MDSDLLLGIVVTIILTLIPLIIATGGTLKQYIINQYPHLLYLTGFWVSMTIWALLKILSYLFNSDLLHFLHIYALIPMGYCAILYNDSISCASIHFFKLFLMTITSTALIIFSFSDAIVTDDIPKFVGKFRDAALTQMTLICAIFIYGSLKILIYTPKNLKLYSLLNLLGTFLIAGPPLFYQYKNFELSILASLSLLAGILINGVIFFKEPTLAFLIPFKTYRIIIQRTNSGIILFKHDWNELEAQDSENIFAAFISAISSCFDQTINKGNVREIKFEEALITFKASKQVPLACILISSSSSITLSSSFNKFANDVFKDYVNIEKDAHSMNKYDKGTELLEKYFRFIP
jgi:hypothetical protein